MMVGAGALIATGALSFWPVCLWAVAGAVAGDGLSYWLGCHYRERLTAQRLLDPPDQISLDDRLDEVIGHPLVQRRHGETDIGIDHGERQGEIEEMLTDDSILWQCTNCYSCYERCPQDVRPVEVIIAMKNLVREDGRQPAEVDAIYGMILKTGRSAPVLASLNKKREQMGLPHLAEIDVELTIG